MRYWTRATNLRAANLLQQQARFDAFVQHFKPGRLHKPPCPGHFMDYDLGYFDDETARLEPIQNPFAARVLPMCRNDPSPMFPERTTHVTGIDRVLVASPTGFEPVF
jgi:hypothetical protein